MRLSVKFHADAPMLEENRVQCLKVLRGEAIELRILHTLKVIIEMYSQLNCQLGGRAEDRCHQTWKNSQSCDQCTLHCKIENTPRDAP